MQQIKSALTQSDIASISVSEMDINLAFEKIHTLIIDTVDHIAPYEEYTPSKHRYHRQAWLPFNLFKSLNRQKTLYKRSILSTATESDCLKYKNYRNTLTRLKRWCKWKYYQDKCAEFRSNTKALWGVINKLADLEKDKSCIISSIKDGDISYNNPKQIANVLNDHFSSVGKRYANSIKTSKKSIRDYLNVISRNTKSMFWAPATIKEVTDVIKIALWWAEVV